jgi:hypothetical protein
MPEPESVTPLKVTDTEVVARVGTDTVPPDGAVVSGVTVKVAVFVRFALLVAVIVCDPDALAPAPDQA